MIGDPAGEADKGALRLNFDRRLLLQFRGCGSRPPTPPRFPREGSAAHADARRDPLRRFPRGRGENNARPFDMLPWLVAVTANRLQPFPVGSADDHTYCLSHGPRIAHSTAFVNPLNAS